MTQPATVLPPPSYDNSVYVFFDAPGLTADGLTFQAEADEIQRRVLGGPYGRVGMSGFFLIDMDWNVNLASPVLSSPSGGTLSNVLARAQARGLAVHLGTVAGVSRGTLMYDLAKLEDRRNCQWYADGLLMQSDQVFSTDVWLTPSRYARKLRRHLETKVRLFAKLLISLRQTYPDTLVSSSGDGEMELNFGRLDLGAPYESQMIADYSPFTVLEFRDWIQHAGLYAPGQAYDGQGYGQGGAIYQADAGLTAFNETFKTRFSTWSLQYFDWSLADPVDGDARAIPAAIYNDPTWIPLPISGPDFIANGFDPPRASNKPSVEFWQLWLTFRQAMVAHYVQDFANWVTSTAGPGGARVDPSRWYSHQIPADYINDTFPGCPNPERRLRTSASPLLTAVTGRAGSLGLTSFDVLDAFGYHRTSHFLFDDVAALKLPNWGLMEYSPSWPFTPDNDVPSIAAQILRAFNAGAHVISYEPWDHFVTTMNPEAFSVFLAKVKEQPRDSAAVAYLPPQVLGLSGSWFSSTISLSWQGQIFPGVPNLAWSDWPPFDHFEVWRGASSDFKASEGELVATTAATTVTGIVPDPVKIYYRVWAVNRSGQMGVFSAAVLPVSPGGASFYTLTPCRIADTRGPAGPLAGPSLGSSASRVFALTGSCDLPAGAKAVSVNITVVNPAAAGFLRFYAGDASPPSGTAISFAAGAVRANNAVLPLSAAGELAVENGAAGSVDLVIDVNGYFQ